MLSHPRLALRHLTPDFIRGVINLRGAVVPVIDLSTRFWNKPSQLNPRSCIVILELQYRDLSLVVGVIVDAVIAVLDIAADNIEPPPAFGTGITPECIAGMGKLDDEFIIILTSIKCCRWMISLCCRVPAPRVRRPNSTNHRM
jgi:Chemotaxis signal transduction protein